MAIQPVDMKSKRAALTLPVDLLFEEDLLEGKLAMDNTAADTAGNVAARGLFLANAVSSSFGVGGVGMELRQGHKVAATPDQAAFTTAAARNLSAVSDMFLNQLKGAW